MLFHASVDSVLSAYGSGLIKEYFLDDAENEVGLLGLDEVKDSQEKTYTHLEPRQTPSRVDIDKSAAVNQSSDQTNDDGKDRSARSRVIPPIAGAHSAESKQMNSQGKPPKRSNRSSSKRSSRNTRSRHESDVDLDNDEDQTPRELVLPGEPLIVPRDKHTVSRKQIDPDCLKVMRRLNRHGHMAFLVGGGVRDLLLGKTPKDYDVSTDATPEQIRTLFRNSRTIGRRFKLNHVYFRGNKIIEVSTFRDTAPERTDDEEIQTLAPDNVFGNAQTDAIRRDLTINGLFYDMQTFSVIDYVGGIDDLNSRTIRTIGDPFVRFQEDPVRMIRAVRHSARTGFKIEKLTYQAISELSNLITVAASARVYEELMRELRGGFSQASLTLLDETGLLQHLLPFLAEAIAEDRPGVWSRLERTLDVIDAQSKSSEEELSAAVIFAALLIGNLQRADLAISANDQSLSGLIDYWTVTPFWEGTPVGEGEGSFTADISANSAKDEPQSYRRTRRTASKSKLGRSILDLVGEVAVSRKDRERMEQLLAARLMMVTREDEAVYSILLNKPYFDDALILLRATAHDDHCQSCLKVWDEKKSSFSRKPGSKRKRSNFRPGRRR